MLLLPLPDARLLAALGSSVGVAVPLPAAGPACSADPSLSSSADAAPSTEPGRDTTSGEAIVSDHAGAVTVAAAAAAAAGPEEEEALRSFPALRPATGGFAPAATLLAPTLPLTLTPPPTLERLLSAASDKCAGAESLASGSSESKLSKPEPPARLISGSKCPVRCSFSPTLALRLCLPAEAQPSCREAAAGSAAPPPLPCVGTRAERVACDGCLIGLGRWSPLRMAGEAGGRRCPGLRAGGPPRGPNPAAAAPPPDITLPMPPPPLPAPLGTSDSRPKKLL